MWLLQLLWPHEGQSVVDKASGLPAVETKAWSHTLQLILFLSFKWPQEGQGMVDRASDLPLLPTKAGMVTHTTADPLSLIRVTTGGTRYGR